MAVALLLHLHRANLYQGPAASKSIVHVSVASVPVNVTLRCRPHMIIMGHVTKCTITTAPVALDDNGELACFGLFG